MLRVLAVFSFGKMLLELVWDRGTGRTGSTGTGRTGRFPPARCAWALEAECGLCRRTWEELKWSRVFSSFSVSQSNCCATCALAPQDGSLRQVVGAVSQQGPQ